MADDKPFDPSLDTSLNDRAVGRGDLRDRTLSRTDPAPGERASADQRGGAADDRSEGPGMLGVHPVGTAVGGLAGAVAAGAAVGSVAGPIGTVVGAAIGAAAGGMTGKLVADLADPRMEDEFWRQNWSDRHYLDGGYTYDQDYRSAYLYGVETYNRHPGRHYDELEPELASGWAQARGSSRLEWGHARNLSRDAWQRAKDGVERATPGDSDRDGK